MNLLGQTLGDYRIVGELGRGGMGMVYRAVHVTQGYHVALKVLSPQLAQDSDFTGRFLREMRVMRQLQHRHIVQLREAGQAQGMLYMAMALMEGGSLEQRLAGGRALDVRTTTTVLTQIASALDYAHRQGIVHRDVKPSNILFDRHGRAVLADFGIAQAAGQSRLTRTGAATGTPEYISPEQAKGLRDLDQRTDIYSLGIVAYRMLTGRVPFQRENNWATMLAHIAETPPPLRQVNRALSADTEAVVLRALAKSPGQRYVSAGQFVQALTTAAHRRVAATPGPRVQQGPGIRIVFYVFGAAFTLLVIVVGLFVFRQSSSDPTESGIPPASGPLIAFESDQDGDKEIYVADPVDWSRWRLTNHPAMDWAPSWSLDGQYLAFVSDRDGFMDVYIMSRRGEGLRNVTQNPAQDSGPVWSSDGRQIAFDSDRDGNLEIYIMNVDGTGLTNLSQHPALDGDPTWSPDGRRIAFESDRDGNFEIYVLSVADGAVKRLTHSSGRDFAPAWSPDGQWIVFECQRDGVEICVMDANGGQLRRLTADELADQQPSWSPDGRQIVWTREQPVTGTWDLYVMDADGQNAHPLLTSIWSETAPAWTR